MGFSHPDYPPLYPTTVAVAWSFFGGINYRLAQVLIAFLNSSAVGLCGCALVAMAPRLLRKHTAIAGAMLGLAGFGIAHEWGTNGYADMLWAAAAVAAVLYGLVAPKSPSNIAIALIAAFAATSTKQEGFIIGVLVIVAIAIRYRRGALRAAGCVLALAATWQVAIRVAGGGGGADSLITGRSAGTVGPGNALIAGPVDWSRVPAIAHVLVHHLAPMAVAAATCGVLGYALLRGERRRIGLGSSFWAWASAGTFVLVLGRFWMVVHGSFAGGFATFLRSGTDRFMIFPELVLLGDIACWIVVAGAALRDNTGARATQTLLASPRSPGAVRRR
jgi:hypothetical protein